MIKLIVFCVLASAVAASDSPSVQCRSAKFRGSWMQTLKGRRFQAFRGIPYAEQPVNELRFQPPKLIKRYSDEVDATKEGPACPQPAREGYEVREDCLRLNVYTPSNSSGANLPVIVFLHPGGFYAFSGRSDVFGPEYMLDRDVVLVTVNYRLGSLGFLSTGDKLAPGNNGFKDQVVALRWIKRNIRSFGGNPNLVTLTGYSAGSFSIGLHMVSPMSRGLFHRAVSMSASPISQVVIGSDQRYLAERQARILNCPTNSSQAIIDCLKTKSAKEMGDSLHRMFEFGFDPVLIWNVVIEKDFGQERFLTEQPLTLIKQGRFHAVPYIISQTKDEFYWKASDVINNATLFTPFNTEFERIAPIGFMLPDRDNTAIMQRLNEAYLNGRGVENTTESADGLGKLYSDAVIGFAVHRFAKLMTKHSPKPVFFYEFAYIGNSSFYTDPVSKKPRGTAHHDDLLYIFTIKDGFPVIELGSKDSEISNKMTALLYNFARYGNPNPTADTPELGSLSWPPMTSSKRQYLRIDEGFSIHENLFEQRYKVWDDLYPIQY